MTFKVHDGVEIDGKSLTNSGGTLSWGGVAVGSGGGVTINSNANNRVLTGDGSNAVAETNLTFDGTNLQIVGSSRGLITEKLRLGATDTSFIERDSTVNIGYRADGMHRFWTYNSSWLERAQITDAGFNLLAGHSYHIGGTAVINSTRGLTNITSGNIAGNLTIDYTGNATNDAGLYVANDNSDWGIYVNKDGSATYGIKIAADGAYPFQIANSSGTEKFRVDSDGDIETVRNINASGTVTADVSGATDHYYFQGNESGTTRYSVYENSNNVWINAWSGLYLRANQHGGSGGGLGASGAVFNAVNGLSVGTYNSTNGGEANGRLQLYGSTANKQADLYCSNGNLHIDADDGNGIYLNWYGSQSASSTAGTYFGNANAGQVARIDGSGNFTLSGTVDGRDVAADGTKLDGIAAGANNYVLPSAITVSSDIQTTAGLLRFTSNNHVLSTNNTHNILFKVGNAGAMGLVGQDSGSNFRWQVYGDGTSYGFLDGTWGSWDMQKAINGAFKVDEGSGLKRVLNEANWTSYITNNNQLTNGAGYQTASTTSLSNYMRLNASADVTNYSHVHTFYTNGNIATTNGSQSSLQCYNNTVGNDAFMTFHIGNDFACYFGLDGGTNKLSVGGWSMGANSYEIYHSGNKPSLATLGFTGASNANYITNNNQLTNGAGYATQSYVGTQVANLVDSSPAALNTLNELAAAIGDDASFSTTITNSIATKLPLVTGVTAMHNTQGTQNTANTVLRTQVNGYTMLGWINTTSGVTTGMDRIYASNDGYIRYVTKATFGAGISSHINYNNIANKPTIPTNNNQLTNGSSYITASNGAITNKLPLAGGTMTGTLTTSGNIAVPSNTGISTSGDWVKVTTNHGYIQIGPANSGHAHIYTDRSNFYFNKDLIYANGHLMYHAGNSSQFTSALNTKLAGIATSANNYVLPTALTATTFATSGQVVIGGNFTNNAYNTVSSTRLLFGGGNDANNYHIGTNMEDFGGNYTKLDLRWHTGIRMGAQGVYGGIRFYNNEDLTSKLMSIGEGNGVTSVKVYNDLQVDGHIYGKYVNNAHSALYRFGGIYFTWDSDSYGTNTHHSIRSTDGDTYGDHITLNSFGNVRINFDSNGNGTNYFRIGHHTTGTDGVLLTIDESGNATFAGNVTAYSDQRLKENIVNIDNALDKVCSMRGIYYNMIADTTKSRRIGLVAQEVEKVLPEVVIEANPEDDKESILSVDYGNIVALLIEGMKEQQIQIDELKKKLETK